MIDLRLSPDNLLVKTLSSSGMRLLNAPSAEKKECTQWELQLPLRRFLCVGKGRAPLLSFLFAFLRLFTQRLYFFCRKMVNLRRRGLFPEMNCAAPATYCGK